MSVWKRLLYYAIGVGMGVLAVIFIFGDREIGCSYFPNDRVLSDLRKKTLVIDENLSKELKENAIDSAAIQSVLLTGKVDFDAVDRGLDSCKTYWVQSSAETDFSLRFENCDSTATVVELKFN